MRITSLKRLRFGLLLLAAVVGLSVAGYMLIGGRDLLDALYMVVITVGTVGFGEHSTLAPAEKVLTMAVIVLGISASVFALGGFVQMMTEGELQKALMQGRNVREIDRLDRHVIVCGFGRVGQILAEQLHTRKQSFVVIDKSPEVVQEAQALGYLAAHGDAAEEDVLLANGIRRAKCLVTVLPNDAVNVFITLTSRNLNPQLQIIARGEQHSTHKKLLQAGANRVVLPAAIGAMRIAAMVTHPSTVELMELVAGRSVLDVEVDELHVPDSSPLVGRTIREIEARSRHGLLVVAIKHSHGGMIFNPEANLSFQSSDIIIVMGRVEDIERFRREYQL